MRPGQFARMKEILLKAVNLPADEQKVYLDEASIDNPELRKKIGLILDVYKQYPDFLNTTVSFLHNLDELTDMTGQTLSHFRIEEKIAVGGMGVLYKAVDTDLSRTVAIKVLRPDLLHDPDSRRRFIREAQAASVLNHPGIVSVYEIGADSDIDFIVMEYVEGRTLNEMILPKGLPLDTVISYAIAMADALKVAYEQGIVHRDLKPSNIMITNDDSVKILDFGISKQLSLTPSDGIMKRPETQITQTGSVIGTIGYMSPEQAIGAKIDERSDIFSLGVVIYQLLTGTPPFEGDHAGAVIHAILHSDPLRVEELRDGVPEEVERVVFKSLQKKPQDRYRSATDLKTDLESLVDILKGKPLELIATEEVFEERAGGIYSALIGREDEMAELDGYLWNMLKGDGRTVMVSGEAGIGKSRLVWELGRKAKENKVRYLLGRCLSVEEDIPYQPVLDIIRTYMDLKGVKNATDLERFIGNKASHLKGRLGVLRAFLYMEGEDEPSLINKEQLWNTVTEFVKVMSKDRPVLLHIDDLHGADVPTLNLLTYMSRNTRRERVMIVCTFRPEELAEDHEVKVHPLVTALKRMKNEGLCDEMSLNRLSANDTRRVIDSIFTEAEFPESFFELVYEETEGNPLFIIEMLKLLREMEVITRAEHGWKLSSKVSRIEVPSKVNDVIVNRLDSLSREERNIVEVASIEGQHFRSDTLCHCLEMPRMKVLRLLQDLEDSHHLIHASKKDYHFDHIKIREVVYDGLMPELRVEYHRLIGEYFRKRYDEEGEYAGKIAHHMLEAGEEREAIPYLLKAGNHAKTLFANEEAIGYFDEGIGIVDIHMEQSPSPDLQRMKLSMLEIRADVRMLIGQYDGARVDYKCLEEVAQELGDKKVYASSLRGVGETFWRAGDCLEALECMEGSLEISREIGDRLGEGRTLSHIGVIHKQSGDYVKALECYKESLEINREIGDRLGEGKTLNNMGIFHHHQSDYERALEFYEESLEIKREIGDRLGESYTLNNIGLNHENRGNYVKALECYKESLEISREIGDRLIEGRILGNIGIVNRKRGNCVEALKYYEKSLVIIREIGDRRGEGCSLINIGEFYRNRGDYIEALECYEESLKICREISDSLIESYALNSIGFVHISRGDYVEALGHLEQAINIQKEIGDKTGQLISQHELCKLWVDVGDRERLLEGLAKAVQLANELDTKRSNALSQLDTGYIKLVRGFYEEAKKYIKNGLETACEIEEIDIIMEGLLAVTQIEIKSGNVLKAQGLAEESLIRATEKERKPNVAQTHLLFAQIHLSNEELKESKSHANQTIKISETCEMKPLLWQAHHYLGKVYLKKKQVSSAKKELEKAKRVVNEISSKLSDALKKSYLAKNEIKELYKDLAKLSS